MRKFLVVFINFSFKRNRNKKDLHLWWEWIHPWNSKLCIKFDPYCYSMLTSFDSSCTFSRNNLFRNGKHVTHWQKLWLIKSLTLLLIRCALFLPDFLPKFQPNKCFTINFESEKRVAMRKWKKNDEAWFRLFFGAN